MSSEQVDCNGPRTTSHVLILFLKHDIQIHEGYWLAASQASIQSLYTSTGSDRSEEQWIKVKRNFVAYMFLISLQNDRSFGNQYRKKMWMTAGKVSRLFCWGWAVSKDIVHHHDWHNASWSYDSHYNLI